MIARLALTILLSTSFATAAELVRQTWDVDGVTREALVHVPVAAADAKPAPLLFFFHGRNGKVVQVSKQHPLHQHWPEALLVYPQGLPTPALGGKGNDVKPGWQGLKGIQGDRDLRFFDVMLAALKKAHRIDERRIYLTGSSNGGGMTFLLWAERGSTFAAIAPSCTSARAMVTVEGEGSISKLIAVPSFHIAGEKDTTVPLVDQVKTIDLLREARKLGPGQPWGNPPVPGCTLYPSSSGTPLITWIYPGGHGLPTNSAPLLVTFFKEHAKP